MQVYKFGGASIKDAEAIRNISKIITKQSDKLIIVVSAIDKTTNHLERLHHYYINSLVDKAINQFSKIKDYHLNICKELNFNNDYILEVKEIFNQIYDILQERPSGDHDFEYDKIVSYGEIISSKIIFLALLNDNLKIKLIDISEFIITDSVYKEANIIWDKSKLKTNNAVKHFSECNYILTQGFIAKNDKNHKTTLGREGSDFTAAVIAYITNSKNVTIWKNVEGIMNADPAIHRFAEKIELLSYQEAIELAFYGAKVIHPKTIKPLENKNIPLFVKSFLNPENTGSVIKKINHKITLKPIYIIKKDQILISISPIDFSFMMEENISKIFKLFVKYRIKVNMTQNSAISFSASIDSRHGKINEFINEIQKEYKVRYNENLVLITIRHYNQDAIEKMTDNKKIYLEQKTRINARYVVS